MLSQNQAEAKLNFYLSQPPDDEISLIVNF